MSTIKKLPNDKLRIEIDDFGGYNSRVTPFTKVPLNAFPVFDNYTMDRVNDMIIKRKGIRRFIDEQIGTESIESIAEHKTSEGNDFVIAKSETSLKYADINGVNPAVQLYFDISTSESPGRIDFLTYQNRLYVANRNEGANVNKVWANQENEFHEHGLIPCNNALIDASYIDQGDVPAGTYYYAVTFLYEGSQESGALLRFKDVSGWKYYPCVVNPATNGLTLDDIPTGNERVTARKIYRSKKNDPTAYYELVTIPDNTTVYYYDNTLDTNLGTQINPALLSDLKKPYRSKYQAVHKETLLQGYLTDDLYKPFENGDVAVTEELEDTGSLTAGATYKYRIFKAWLVNESNVKPRIILSPYIEKTLTLTSGSAVNINFIAGLSSGGWTGLVAIQRTEANSSVFKWIESKFVYGAPLLYPSITAFVDTIADVSMLYDPPSDKVFQTKFPQNYYSVFNSYVALSDTSKPDSFSGFSVNSNNAITINPNTIRIGEDNGDAIVGIFSEYNRVVVFKENSLHAIFTSAQSKSFWVSNVIHDKIGATDRCILQLPDSKFFFGKVMNEFSGKGSVKFYLWDGQREPVEVSTNIDTILNNTGTFTIYDLAYDDYKKWIYITVKDSVLSRTYILIYDLSLGGVWYVWYNDLQDLAVRGMFKLKNYGVVFGAVGTIHTQKDNAFIDEILTSGSFTDKKITAIFQSKTFDFGDMDYDLEKFRLSVYARSIDQSVRRESLIFDYYHKIDNDTEVLYKQLPAIAVLPNLKRPFITLRGNCSSYHFRIVNAQAIDYVIPFASLDLMPRHIAEGGK
jgi:hypothetical protein